jgi:hypothetical protein
MLGIEIGFTREGRTGSRVIRRASLPQPTDAPINSPRAQLARALPQSQTMLTVLTQTPHFVSSIVDGSQVHSKLRSRSVGVLAKRLEENLRVRIGRSGRRTLDHEGHDGCLASWLYRPVLRGPLAGGRDAGE